MRSPSSCALVALAALLAPVFATTACSNLPPTPPPKPPPFALKVELPPALASQRAEFTKQLYTQVAAVGRWFRQRGIAVADAALIDRVVVLGDRAAVEAELLRRFSLPRDKVPQSFAGTVQHKALLLVTPTAFSQSYARLYPGYRWTPDAYWQLAAHEIAHRAHALWATRKHGSEDGMGPRWLYEGVAIACAGQFAAHRQHLSPKAVAETIAADATQQGPLSYPRYGRLLRSLLASFPLRYLLERAPDKTLAAALARDYLPSAQVLEHPSAGPARSLGTVLLVHGSAPFNADGRVPIAGLKSPYAQHALYADLSSLLRKAGWSVLRYHKPGVSWQAVNRAQYAKTDLALLERQLRNLWRFMPASRPRVVLAWSEGSLQLRELLPKADAAVLLGGIATTLGDVIAAQGGPKAVALKRQLAGQPRTAMLGHDRPVGRVLDELALPPNWLAFAPHAKRLPLLVLHGSADKEVPVAQARLWRKRLPKDARLTVQIIAGGDHRGLKPGTRRAAPLAKRITEWLATLPTRVRHP